MPIWADTGNPPGPLNYRQIQELIAFLRATSDVTYIVRDEHLLDPKVDPVTGEVLTFTGWRDPNYEPAPEATPYPACWADEFASASEAPASSVDPNAEVVTVTAQNLAFTETEVTAPADASFTLSFDNQDASVLHDVQIKDASDAEVFKTPTFEGAAKRDFTVPALPAGSYPFVCTVHPDMTGTLTAE
jgi:plastocyanin